MRVLRERRSKTFSIFLRVAHVGLICFTGNAISDSDYLEPEDSRFGGMFMPEYYEMVINAYPEAYEDDVVLRVLVFPSNAPEYVVGIRRDGEQHRVFASTPESAYWFFFSLERCQNGSTSIWKDGKFQQDTECEERLKKLIPDSPDEMKVSSCEFEIAEPLANQIASIWETMLREVRYPDSRRLGADGVTFHYSMQVGVQKLAGKIWSPKRQSRAWRLTELSRAMYRLCIGSRSSLEELAILVESFER